MPEEEECVLPRWAPLLRPEQIRRLYRNEAEGVPDEALLDEVAYGLYARCQSIAEVMDAFENERFRCPLCGAVSVHHWRSDRSVVLRCACGWSAPWESYHRKYKRMHLHGGGTMPQVREYLERFPKAAASPRQKMLLIDSLLHAFHWELQGACTRPTARGFIDGTLEEVVRLLLELAYGPHSSPESMSRRDHFLQTMLTKTRWALPAGYRDTEAAQPPNEPQGDKTL